MAIEKIFSEAEKFELMRQRIASTSVNAFRVRVTRREQPHLTPELLATFEGCSVEQLGSPETWLPELFGGGSYELRIAHMVTANDELFPPLKMTYATIPVKKLTPTELFFLVDSEAYHGPKGMVYPQRPKVAVNTVIDKAPLLPALSTTSAGGPETPNIQHVASNGSVTERMEATRLAVVQENLMRQEKELSEKANDMKMEALRSEMRTLMTQPAKQWDLPSLLTAASPFILAFFDSRKESEARMFQMQQQQQTAQLEMMKLLNQKPELDPAMRELLDKASKKDDFGMLKNVTEMMGAMTTTTMQIIQSNAELMAASQPQGDSPQMKLAQTGLKVLGAILSNGKQIVEDDDEGQQGVEQQEEAQALPENAAPEKKKYSQRQLLERALIRKDPKEKVAARFLKALKSAKFTGWVNKKYGGSYVEMVNALVITWQNPDGTPWVAGEGNIEYIKEAGMFMYREAQKAGFFPADAPPAPKVKAKEAKEEKPMNGASAGMVPVEAPSKEVNTVKAAKEKPIAAS